MGNRSERDSQENGAQAPRRAARKEGLSTWAGRDRSQSVRSFGLDTGVSHGVL